jgi:hypothetical protein
MGKNAASEETRTRISRIDIREMTGMAAGIARAKGAGVSRWVREWITTVQYDTLLTVVISGEQPE